MTTTTTTTTTKRRTPRQTPTARRLQDHLHVLKAYSRDHTRRYCCVPGCRYGEQWDEQRREYLALSATGTPGLAPTEAGVYYNDTALWGENPPAATGLGRRVSKRNG